MMESLQKRSSSGWVQFNAGTNNYPEYGAHTNTVEITCISRDSNTESRDL